MAGPVASVLLKSASNPETIDVIHAVIDRIGQERNGDNFYVAVHSWNTDIENMRPFSFEIIFLENEAGHNEDRCRQIAHYLGFYPKWEIVLCAMRNGDEDHRTLGLLALQIAEAVDGYIDFNGALSPAHIKNIPGSVYPISYNITDNTKGIAHISDTQFLRNWLESEHFRMIK